MGLMENGVMKYDGRAFAFKNNCDGEPKLGDVAECIVENDGVKMTCVQKLTAYASADSYYEWSCEQTNVSMTPDTPMSVYTLHIYKNGNGVIIHQRMTAEEGTKNEIWLDGCSKAIRTFCTMAAKGDAPENVTEVAEIQEALEKITDSQKA